MPPDDEFEWQGLDGLDKLLDHRVRLSICVLLCRYREVRFRRFKELLAETDGSLGAHLRRLEDDGYISADKRFEARKPVTWYRLTREGKKAVSRHITALQRILGQAQSDS